MAAAVGVLAVDGLLYQKSVSAGYPFTDAGDTRGV